ncbi:hypothetical protein L6164_029366 [Bauhinia variegata]|uniref:Uncharacterized protein n=1 Tax=Bauhinia variegata TaxID=167791 RepID=A0ACB9L8Z4_BAUVA|nr:hypothetical protein L6164_029366 [Bauhinia variegata]
MALASISTSNFLILFALMAALSSTSMAEAQLLSDPPTLSLATRLKLEGGSANCWDSLFQLQACSGEVIMFFLNGETYLGPHCCQAIRVIGHECWPNIISTLGFTTQEGDILEDYCVEAAHNPSTSQPPSVEPTKMIP